MGSDTAIATTERREPRLTPPRAAPAAAPVRDGVVGERPSAPARRRGLSPLTQRILAVNVLALALLVAGLLYLNRYEAGLIETETQSLRTQAQIFAAALGEGAVIDSLGEGQRLAPELARQMMRRLIEPTRARTRLFDVEGRLIADSRVLRGSAGLIQVDELPPLEGGGGFSDRLDRIYDRMIGWLPRRENYPPYVERPEQSATDYAEVERALLGEEASAVRAYGSGLVISYAVPLQRYKQVLGAILLSVPSTEIEQAVRAVRFDILKMFALALAVTVFLSLYLAGTIAQPVRRLAAAAERVRRGQGRKATIPDFTQRGDEIGELSAALRDMTNALWQRMDAIERFAADVAHEIKNPLTSLRSAVETAARLEDPVRQRKLLAIVLDDVQRLDRLISDISDASRLDAELSRLEPEPVSVRRMLEALVELHEETAGDGAPRLVLAPAEAGGGEALVVPGLEDRLVQVFRNLIANAVSFSPPGGTIRLWAGRRGQSIVVIVEDDGPGIPESKLEAIFERFYSERPKSEKFGTHSGLGLSISKQILEAHRGSIRAENRIDDTGAIRGARFIVRLPAA